MNRRTLLAGAGIAVTSSLGGCLDGSLGDGTRDGGDEPASGDPDRPTELRDATITLGIDDAPAADEPPRVAFDEEASVVTVEGTVSYSSSSCGEVALKRATYEPGGSAATVRVVGRRDPEAGEECTDDIAADSYRVELTFDMGVPDTVEVTEDGEFDEFVVTAP
ncbi:hypothetical protein C471_11241 [Halorubrum saccharovorum DSM 1137]|mgnify:FL=1|uniref:Lipoprotein n=1 Tax=Halorubrum saccharovorum DSM 1137 TaxID=1227484 RepID=M0DRD1_9EURY|nr:hypothetical protein [Halorubrum saccharovorum]ELZ38025.1 hypothetical protein C471_11241 [Halorubrum saccharovorum DSM 1137]